MIGVSIKKKKEKLTPFQELVIKHNEGMQKILESAGRGAGLSHTNNQP
tara:strand:- start:283 stop:426 length:144 start_codon:yes stop_codon:yes gene_type:complete